MQKKIFISGLYSGSSPSPGLGVARSIKAHWPDLSLIGTDHFAGSSGLHHEVFDDAMVFPPWNLINHEKHAMTIQAWLDEGHVVLPCLDLEIAWLAERLNSHPRLLAPSAEALAAVAKPRAPAAECLPFQRPPILEASAPDTVLADFCRQHSWRVWLKGPHHEAVMVRDWRQLEACRTAMAQRWQTDKLFLQAHVQGHEESICFAAYEGELLDAIHMRKRQTTGEGKTWAGRVRTLNPDLRQRLAQLLKTLNWTGAGEIELLVEPLGDAWFMEWNTRFPAWIHGSSLVGHNLPAQLIAKALGRTMPAPSLSAHPEFTRVVMEIPVRSQLPLPIPVEPLHQGVAMGKYAAGMSSILTTLIKFDSKDHKEDTTKNQTWTLDAATQKELRALALGPAEACPERLFLKEKADRDFQSAATVASQASMRLGFSIKTAPDKRYLDLAKGTNMLAECISQLEVRRALNHGWDPSHIILNGPGKWWPDPKKVPEGLFAVFCDSLTELERLIHSGRSDQHWGVRLKIPSQGSRFGVELEEPDDFNELCRLIRQFPKGMGCAVHMHMSPTMLGEGFWLDTVGSALAWAERIADQTGREIPILDLGGGYHPRDFAKTPFARIRLEAAARLPGFKYLIAEPGRAVTQENMVLHTRVLDVRRFQGELQDIVIDASIAELPLARGYPHRFIWAPLSGDWHEIPRGPVKVLGRICMEDDILSGGLAIPNSIKIGDRILITDAGAYERSMSYEFARGGLGSTEGMADSSYL